MYGPLAGATSMMFGVFPPGGCGPVLGYWRRQTQLNILCTPPTAIRSLMSFGKEPLLGEDLSLKILGTVGEPINENLALVRQNIGKKCPIVDTWWQTETGGTLIFQHGRRYPGIPS